MTIVTTRAAPPSAQWRGGAPNRSWQVRGAPWYHLRVCLRSPWADFSPSGQELTCAATVLEKVVSRV